MSDQEEENLQNDGEREEGDGESGQENFEDGIDYEPAISAIPPKVSLHEESQVEVSASPAFQCLDDLFQAGKLTGTRVAMLKAKYTQLHDTLKKTRLSETDLLQNAKNLTNTMEKQKKELEKADDFPENINTEVERLRQQLLKFRNEIAQTEDRDYQLQYKVTTLTEEKKILEREYSRLPKVGELEKKMKELQQACDDMRREIAQRQLETKNLREDYENRKREYDQEYKEYEIKVDEMEKLKGDLVAVNSIPNQIVKEADKIYKQKNDVSKNLKDVYRDYKELVEKINTLEARRRELGDQKMASDLEFEKQDGILEDKRNDFDETNKQYQAAKEKEAVLMGDRATLDISLRHIYLEKKNLHEIHSRKVREKDRDMRNLKKAKLQLKMAEDALLHSKSIHDKVKGTRDSMPRDDGTLLKKREDLTREVTQTKMALAQQNNLTAVEQVKVENSIKEEERLLFEQTDLRIEVVELTRLAAIKADEREQKARDFMRAEMRYHRAVEDLKTKKLQIQDHKKKVQEMQQKLKEFAKMYDIIKNERNKCVNLIQTSTQKAAEMREKIRILQNEIEILRTAAAQKERQLQKERLKHLQSIVVRDSLRNEVAKQRRIENDLGEDKEQLRVEINKLSSTINSAEDNMVQLRKTYESAIQHRNDRGVHLIERNEEVCIFYEKVNIQDQMIRNGDVELSAREEEIRFLKMSLAEEERALELLRKTVPNKKNLEAELTTLQIQLAQCQDRMLDLEKALENPYDETRVRYLEGKDLTPAELQKKVEELEIRLAEKEEQLLERDLICEQVARLGDRVKSKVDSGKSDTLNLAKKVNDLQTKIKDQTRKMMAIVSELSMKQAEAMKLQQEVNERESDLEQAYIRMEKGEAPSDLIEEQYLKMQRDEHRRKKEREEARLTEDEAEQYRIQGDAYTTAEPRPNAYIPDDETELPIPRPYGSHAPFKPTEPGSTMRHIRKPIPQPIEI